MENYRTALRNCFKRRAARLECEYRIKAADGTYRWVEDHGLPIRNKAGRTIRLAGAVSDITRRHEVEQALRDRDQEFNAVLDTIEYGVLFMDADLRAKIINRAFRKMWGISDEFIRARRPTMGDLINYNRHNNLYDVAEAEFDDYVARRVEGVRSGVTSIGEIRRLDERIIQFQVQALPDGGRMLTYFDITDIKHSEEQARDARETAENALKQNTLLVDKLTQRTADLTESLEQQTAAADILGSISESMTDTKPIFNAIVRNLRRLFGTRFAVVQLLQDGMVHMPVADGEPGFERLTERYPRPLDSHTVGGRAMLSKQAVQCAPVLDNPTTPEATVQFARDFGFNSVLFAPMVRAGNVIGAIGAARRDPIPFTDKQIALIRHFADQAVIAIENVRLFEAEQQRTNELSEALAQQTATADVLRVISSSQGNLKPVFEAILTNAVRICDAEFGNMALMEGDGMRRAASYNAPPVFEQMRPDGALIPLQQSPLGRLHETKQTVNIADLAADPAYVEGPLYKFAGARATLAVPMFKDGTLIGGLVLYRMEPVAFGDKQVELLTNFARQAVIAIENARLLSELRQRTDELARSVEELRALGEMSQAVNSTLDLEMVLNTIVTKAVQLSATEAGAIYVFDAGTRISSARNLWHGSGA